MKPKIIILKTEETIIPHRWHKVCWPGVRSSQQSINVISWSVEEELGVLVPRYWPTDMSSGHLSSKFGSVLAKGRETPLLSLLNFIELRAWRIPGVSIYPNSHKEQKSPKGPSFHILPTLMTLSHKGTTLHGLLKFLPMWNWNLSSLEIALRLSACVFCIHDNFLIFV
jgi:hypothetical protein